MPTTTRNYHLGAVKPHVKAAAEEAGERFDYTVIGGWRAVGSVPNSDHPKGLAIDLMTFSRSKGDATAEWFIENAQRLGVTYVIYWKRIWNAKDGWHDYDGPSPHVDHVHVSFADGPGSATPGAAEGSGNGNPLNPANWPVVKQIEGFSETLQSPIFWTRIGYYSLGAMLIIAGLIFLFRKPLQTAATLAVTKGKAA